MRFNTLTIIFLSTCCGYSQVVETLDIEKAASATITLQGYPDWIEIEKNSVWVSNEALNSLQRIDPKTNALVAEVTVNQPCAAFTIGFGSVWVMSCADKALVRIDLETNKVIASIPLTLADAEGSIVAAEGGVWVLTDKKGVLTRVDPKTNEIAASIRVSPNSYAVMAGFGMIWITNTGEDKSTDVGHVQCIDPKTNKIVSRITVGRQPRFLAVGEGGVWTFNQLDGSVTRINPKTNKVVATIACHVPGTGGDISAGKGFVWVRAKKDLLLKINTKTNKVETVYGPPAGSGAVRVGYSSVWITAHDVNKVWRLDVKK